eukprot:Clim_evm23s143 gene=Clim_evmTU23s143
MTAGQNGPPIIPFKERIRAPLARYCDGVGHLLAQHCPVSSDSWQCKKLILGGPFIMEHFREHHLDSGYGIPRGSVCLWCQAANDRGDPGLAKQWIRKAMADDGVDPDKAFVIDVDKLPTWNLFLDQHVFRYHESRRVPKIRDSNIESEPAKQQRLMKAKALRKVRLQEARSPIVANYGRPAITVNSPQNVVDVSAYGTDGYVQSTQTNPARGNYYVQASPCVQGFVDMHQHHKAGSS